jgi:hypothetical protein
VRITITAAEWVTGRAIMRAWFDAGLEWGNDMQQPHTGHYTKYGTDAKHEAERVITVTITPKGDQ